MTDQASHFTGSVPEHYDRHLGPRIFQGYAADLAGRIARLKPRSVLELAAGTGIVTRQLRDTLPEHCEILATDLNEPMLDIARQKFSDHENIEFQTADASRLSFADARFDCVTCQFGVMFFPDKQASYAEVARVLKPGGSYQFNVWGSWSNNPFAEIAHQTVERFFPENPPGFYRVPFGYNDAEQITGALEKAGFDDVTSTDVKLNSAIPSAADFARGLVFGNPLQEEIDDRGGDAEEICAAIATDIEKGLGGQMPLQALVIEARMP